MPLATHPDLQIIKFVVHVEGEEPVEVPVDGADSIEFKIPESSNYYTTVYFKVKNRTLKDLKYKQIVKRHGITFKQHEYEIGPSYEPSEETVYSKDFAKDTTPGGFLVRATYPCTSTYYADGEELYTAEWTLEITKKG